jgi:hypothetical protein
VFNRRVKRKSKRMTFQDRLDDLLAWREELEEEVREKTDRELTRLFLQVRNAAPQDPLQKTILAAVSPYARATDSYLPNDEQMDLMLEKAQSVRQNAEKSHE